VTAVSVVMPAYNHARYLPRAIESVLGQTYPDLELIVVDDASTDDTAAVLTGYGDRVRVVRLATNLGISGARNAGLREARGRYLAFLDADDLWVPEKLELQVGVLESEPDVDVVHGLITIVDDDLNVLEDETEAVLRFYRNAQARGYSYETFVRWAACNIDTVVVRRECIDSVGGFDDEMRNCEDRDWFFRLVRRHRFHLIELPLALYRQHTASTGAGALAVGMKQLVDKHLPEIERELGPGAGDEPVVFLLGKKANACYTLDEYVELRGVVSRMLRLRPSLLANRTVLKYALAAWSPSWATRRARVLRRRARTA
jgi:glycosyltransferase involved in cell wall biosynthesis